MSTGIAASSSNPGDSATASKTLILRAAITGVNAENEGMKWYEVVPVAAVVGGVTAITGHRDQDTTLFILAVPFFMNRYGIKTVMLISLIAWTLRFGLFAYGDPGPGLWMIVLACIIYGVAFNFFHIAGSLFVETQVEPSMRSSGQGLFFMMSNGFGALFGSVISGIVIDKYFIIDGVFNWRDIWLSFASYAALTALLFVILFKSPEKETV